MPFHFQKKLFFFLTFAFIAFTVIGTLSHEFGHYIVARSFGYEARINYAHAWWSDAEYDSLTDVILENYLEELKADKDFPVKERFFYISKKHKENSFWITLGGPVQTILTGTLGLIGLFIFGKNYSKQNALKISQWLLIFLSLFWLRQTANFTLWLVDYLFTGDISGPDEVNLAKKLELPYWFLMAITGVIGGIVLTIVVFKFIPLRQRFTFIISGLVGGVAGYILWLVLLGPLVMP